MGAMGSQGGSWQLGPFQARSEVTLAAAPDLRFDCPVSGRSVAWAGKDVFNPGAVVHQGRVHLLVRGEDHQGRWAGTSRLGLAVSGDGVHFELEPEPVLFPDTDRWQAWEWPGGCEDPRLVESPDEGFVCLYTGFDGKKACLMAATSPDLHRWHKRGPAFAGTPHASRWSKSGAIVTEVVDDRLVAVRRDDRFWMYWGEGVTYAATSTDLVTWEPLEFDPTADRYLARADEPDDGWRVERVPGAKVLRPVLFPRRGGFDSLLTEPGPPAVATEAGIVLIYNGANHPGHGDPSMAAYAYQPGQACFDPADPSAVVARAGRPFLTLGDAERRGQVDDVCFAQGLVWFRRRWHLYFGMADSRVGVALGPDPDPPADPAPAVSAP
jgi:beta-1,2-mannosidase